MMRYLVLAFVMIFVNSQAQDFSVLEKRTFSDEDIGNIPYRILFPKNYNKVRKYPLVLFLHGAGERGEDNEKQLVHGVKHFIDTDSREDYPCILIAPQCPENDYWGSVVIDRSTRPLTFTFDYDNEVTNSLQLALKLVKYIRRSEAVDKDRIYITGLSMGGMGTLEAIYREPKLFAAAAPVCGGGDIAAFRKKHAKIPFWFFHGDADVVVPVDFSRDMVVHLKSLGANLKYSEYPGVNHNSWENAYADPDLLPWIFAQRR